MSVRQDDRIKFKVIEISSTEDFQFEKTEIVLRDFNELTPLKLPLGTSFVRARGVLSDGVVTAYSNSERVLVKNKASKSREQKLATKSKTDSRRAPAEVSNLSQDALRSDSARDNRGSVPKASVIDIQEQPVFQLPQEGRAKFWINLGSSAVSSDQSSSNSLETGKFANPMHLSLGVGASGRVSNKFSLHGDYRTTGGKVETSATSPVDQREYYWRNLSLEAHRDFFKTDHNLFAAIFGARWYELPILIESSANSTSVSNQSTQALQLGLTYKFWSLSRRNLFESAFRYQYLLNGRLSTGSEFSLSPKPGYELLLGYTRRSEYGFSLGLSLIYQNLAFNYRTQTESGAQNLINLNTQLRLGYELAP